MRDIRRFICVVLFTTTFSSAVADPLTLFSSMIACSVALGNLIGGPPAELVLPDPKSLPKDDPGGHVKLTDAQFVAILNYIGAPVKGGYAEGGRAVPLALDPYADVRLPSGKAAPSFSVLKKILGKEIETNPAFADAVTKLVDRVGKEKITDADLTEIVSHLTAAAKSQLKDKDIGPETAIANLVMLRSAMIPLKNDVVRAVLNYEVGFEDGKIPAVGQTIAFSSAKGAVASTNPRSSLGDSIAYGEGKIARAGNPAGAKILILEYSRLDVKGVAIQSAGTPAIDAIDSHLTTGIRPTGETFTDQSVKVSRNEVIVSPQHDLVVIGTRPDPSNPSVVYVTMGRKDQLPKK